jgi:hypothetical protein
MVADFRSKAVGFGHLATIEVKRDGSAIFSDFRPKHAGWPVNPGVYRVVPLKTKVKFAADGTPTVGSFSVLAGEVAELEDVDAQSVYLAYYKTSDAETAALHAYFQDLDRFSKGKWSWTSIYIAGIHDCVEICNIAMSEAGHGLRTEILDTPNWIFDLWYQTFADSSYFADSGEKVKKGGKKKKPKEDVNSTFIPCIGGLDCGGYH